MRYLLKIKSQGEEEVLEFPGITNAVSKAAEYIGESNIHICIFDTKIQKIILQKGVEAV